MTNLPEIDKTFFKKINSLLANFYNQKENVNFTSTILDSIKRTIDQNKNIITIANGGSSAIASHFTTDLVKNFSARALFLSDHGLLTCLSNDYGYDQAAVQFIKRFSSPGDTVILISSSGKSVNIINAAKFCLSENIACFGLGGFGLSSPLSKILKPEMALQINSDNYNVIELMHLAILLDVVENLLH